MSRLEHSTRLSGGLYRGRELRQPGVGTRPVSSRIRAAIFDVLGQDLTGLTVLDLYAGSGALGIEALSRQATDATFVDKARLASDCIKANLASLGLTGHVLQKSAKEALDGLGDYDLIFFDPPYADFDAGEADVAASHLTSEGILIMSTAASHSLPPRLGPASMVKVRTYDKTQLAYYKVDAR